MLLLLTGSSDGTADRIVQHSELPVFRFNLDLFSEYKVIHNVGNWSITNQAGLTITSETATRVFWWKAFSYGLDLDSFLLEELRYFFRELYSWFGYRDAIIGNPPNTESLIGKLRQLEIASKYFSTSETHLHIGVPFEESAGKKFVVKSLTSGLTVSNKAMFTQEVDLSKLDPKLLWYTQELIVSDFDVTVLVFGNKMRGFSRSREKLEGIDWRSEQFTNEDKWIAFEISPEMTEGIGKFCQEIGVEWGRIDFMKKVDSQELQFLEMNMNGQWVFLDFENEYGLINEVVEYIGKSPTHSQVNLRSGSS
jgi:hypothetical protein